MQTFPQVVLTDDTNSVIIRVEKTCDNCQTPMAGFMRVYTGAPNMSIQRALCMCGHMVVFCKHIYDVMQPVESGPMTYTSLSEFPKVFTAANMIAMEKKRKRDQELMPPPPLPLPKLATAKKSTNCSISNEKKAVSALLTLACKEEK